MLSKDSLASFTGDFTDPHAVLAHVTGKTLHELKVELAKEEWESKFPRTPFPDLSFDCVKDTDPLSDQFNKIYAAIIVDRQRVPIYEEIVAHIKDGATIALLNSRLFDANQVIDLPVRFIQDPPAAIQFLIGATGEDARLYLARREWRETRAIPYSFSDALEMIKGPSAFMRRRLTESLDDINKVIAPAKLDELPKELQAILVARIENEPVQASFPNISQDMNWYTVKKTVGDFIESRDTFMRFKRIVQDGTKSALLEPSPKRRKF
jgi:hypothetical protein